MENSGMRTRNGLPVCPIAVVAHDHSRGAETRQPLNLLPNACIIERCQVDEVLCARLQDAFFLAWHVDANNAKPHPPGREGRRYAAETAARAGDHDPLARVRAAFSQRRVCCQACAEHGGGDLSWDGLGDGRHVAGGVSFDAGCSLIV